MKTLFFALVGLIACGPTELDVSKELSQQATEHTGESQQKEQIPEGVIPADDCQHIDIGDKACNFTLYDQNGDVWELYDHYGDIIVLDFSTIWCGPCQYAARHTQQLQDDYSGQRVQIVTILIDGPIGGTPPTQNDISSWVADHNITTAPTLIGSRELIFDPAGITGYPISAFPTYLYIDRNMNFYSGHVGFSEEYVRQTIEEGL
tara:strand:+ start:258 stop:872 length:615 start_codon:yes stop_codon:yes gene_type:complete